MKSPQDVIWHAPALLHVVPVAFVGLTVQSAHAAPWMPHVDGALAVQGPVIEEQQPFGQDVALHWH